MGTGSLSEDKNAPPFRASGPRHVGDSDYRLMVDAVVDYAIFLLDPNGIVLSWNTGAKLLKGYEADDVVGRHFSLFYPQDLLDRGWPEHELEVARATGRFEDEGYRIRKDGSPFWANIVITKLVRADGEFRGFCKITRDLTARRQQEEQLRGSEERFRLMIENVKDYAIFMLDPDGRVLSWNAGARETKGYEASEIIGKHFSVFYPADVIASGLPAEELRIAKKEGRFEDEGWRLRKDGSRFWANVVITSLLDAKGIHRGFAKITRNLTDRRRIHTLEEEGRRMTTFLAMFGHEMRNPLAPISNALSIMQQEEIASPSLRRARDIISRQVGQITRLVDDLLDISRVANGKVQLETQPVDMREVVDQAVEAVTPMAAAKSQTLHVNTGDSGLFVDGDRLRLVQVVSNLLTNAVKFTPAQGWIGVSAGHFDSRVELRVTDNGDGIPPWQLGAIFGLFVQVEKDMARSQGGLGLGLSLVRQLVALHGGEVAAYSSGVPGEGAEFVVRLPNIGESDVSPAPGEVVSG